VPDLHGLLDRAGENRPYVLFLSSNSLHIQATGAGHEIHLFQPERVIEGISRAVLALRTRASLVQ
jgi:hypothetical protein